MNQAEARLTEGGLLFCPKAADMRSYRTEDDAVVLSAPAKVNLSLAITGRREDGYHTLDTIMSTVTLADELRVSWYESLSDLPPERQAEARLQLLPGLTLGITGLRDLARLRLNTVSQAALILTAAFGEQLAGLKGHMQIDLEKRIPFQAGLGGGSADAAALLRYLLMRWQDLLPPHDEAYWVELSAAVGADVPFCMVGGSAHCTGIGEKVERLPHPGSWPVILIKPTIGSSTPTAFARYDEAASAGHGPNHAQVERNHQLLDRMEQLASLERGTQEAAALMQEMQGLRTNDFETLIAPDCPEVLQILRLLGEVWPEGLRGMSGSGTACFAMLPLTPSVDELDRLKAGLDDVLGVGKWRAWTAELLDQTHLL